MQYENNENNEREQDSSYGYADAAKDTLSDIHNRDRIRNNFNQAHEKKQQGLSNQEKNGQSLQNGNRQNANFSSEKQPGASANGMGAPSGVAETAKNASGEAAKEGAKELAKKGGEVATKAAADAATFGLAEVIFAAMRAIKATKNAMESITERDSAEADYGIKNGTLIILIVVLSIIFIGPIMGTIILKVTPGSSQSYQETEYGGAKDTIRAKNNYTFGDGDPDGKIKTQFDNDSPLGHSIEEYYKLIDEAIKVAFKDYCIQTINDLTDTFWDKLINPELIFHDSSLSKKFFLQQKYPYCIGRTNGTFYRVGDFLKKYESEVTDYETLSLLNNSGLNYQPIPDSDLNNDINYAEIMSVFAQNPKYAWNKCTLDEYRKFLNSEKTQHLFYEMTVEGNEPWYHAKKTKMVQKEDGTVVEETEWECDYPRSQVPEGHIPFLRKYYFRVIVKPYGLRELYAMVDIDKDAAHFDFSEISNYEMINRHELYIRTFARDKENLLGPRAFEHRNKKSTIYEDLKKNGTDPEAPGRSLWFYIENSLNSKYLNKQNPPWYPDDDFPSPPDISYDETDETVILDMPTYINQAGYINFVSYGFGKESRGGSSSYTIQNSGCCDCSYMMSASYYQRKVYTANEVVNICKNMVSGGQFQTPTFLSSVGMTGNETRPFDINFIQQTIREGKPLIFHIRGHWEYGGRVLHKSYGGHFLVIMGYSPDGFFFYDPGSKDNTTGGAVPYEAFIFVNDKYVRAPYLPGYTPHFKAGYEPKEAEDDTSSEETTDPVSNPVPDPAPDPAPIIIESPFPMPTEEVIIPEKPLLW